MKNSTTMDGKHQLHTGEMLSLNPRILPIRRLDQTFGSKSIEWLTQPLGTDPTKLQKIPINHT